MTDEEICKVADPMMDDVVAGIARRDYTIFSSHFSLDLKTVQTPEHFLACCTRWEADWGRPGDRELIAIFRKPKAFTLCWRQGFSQAQGDIAALLTIALKGGRHFVDHVLIH